MLALALTAGIVAWMLLDAGTRKDVARLDVGDEPAETTFAAAEDGVLVMHSVIDLDNESHAEETTDALPHILDYEIRVEQDGREVARITCNPFQARAFSRTSSRGERRRQFRGRLDHCAAPVPAGELTLEAHRTWRKRDERFRFRETGLVVTL
jgi:hypothetical protein